MCAFSVESGVAASEEDQRLTVVGCCVLHASDKDGVISSRVAFNHGALNPCQGSVDQRGAEAANVVANAFEAVVQRFCEASREFFLLTGKDADAERARACDVRCHCCPVIDAGEHERRVQAE